MIKSNKVYNARDYLKYVGITTNSNDNPMGTTPLLFVEKTLKEHNKPFWNYPLNFINNLQGQEPDIVLVDCSYYDGHNFIQEYRWFKV